MRTAFWIFIFEIMHYGDACARKYSGQPLLSTEAPDVATFIAWLALGALVLCIWQDLHEVLKK